MEKIKDRIGENPVVEKLARAEETAWINPKKECWDDAGETLMSGRKRLRMQGQDWRGLHR